MLEFPGAGFDLTVPRWLCHVPLLPPDATPDMQGLIESSHCSTWNGAKGGSFSVTSPTSRLSFGWLCPPSASAIRSGRSCSAVLSGLRFRLVIGNVLPFPWFLSPGFERMYWEADMAVTELFRNLLFGSVTGQRGCGCAKATRTYRNVDGNIVPSPSKHEGTAICNNSKISSSDNRQGTCSNNEGVGVWLKQLR